MSPKPATTTRLGAALAVRRGDQSIRATADTLKLNYSAYFRVETGERSPSMKTAAILARWLGWSMEEVAAAAEEMNDAVPADPSRV